jgi:hypothetical protein
MGTVALNNNFFANNYNFYKADYSTEKSFFEELDLHTGKSVLSAQGGNNIFHYLKSFDLSKGPGLMLLPLNHYYYYDENDLKNVRTLINLKRLNLIKHLNMYLNTLCRILPPNVNFIGCFSESRTLKWNGFLLRLSERFSNLLDSNVDHDIDKKYVTHMLEKYGFNIIDMTEMDGLTYFYSQNRFHNKMEIRA